LNYLQSVFGLGSVNGIDITRNAVGIAGSLYDYDLGGQRILVSHDPFFDREITARGGVRVVGTVTGIVTVANPASGIVSIDTMPAININFPDNGLPVNAGSNADLLAWSDGGTNLDWTGNGIYDEDVSSGDFGTRRAQGVDISRVDALSFDQISVTGGRKGSEIIQSALTSVGGAAFGAESSTTDLARAVSLGVGRLGDTALLVTNGNKIGSWTFNGSGGSFSYATYTNGFGGQMVSTSALTSIAGYVNDLYSPVYDQMTAFAPMMFIDTAGYETGLVGHVGGIRYLPSTSICLTSASVASSASWFRSFLVWASGSVLFLVVGRRVMLVLVGIGVI